ncbi:MAG: BtpA/SgcQ family protein [Phycisphaerales bacterium]|nr:MAG: BtpA/SgcQ family protein [Phycisphaerales bacterium]
MAGVAESTPALPDPVMIDLPSPALIGVIHLPALPGSPCHQFTVEEIVARAVADARTLRDAAFDAVIIENFGDVPFNKNELGPASVATVAIVADHVQRAAGLALGINALRNDARAALGIAAAVGARFVRVNVHTGVSATDQGFIEGKARDTLLYRKQLGRRIALLADVHVKHATQISQPDLAGAARETAYRGLADGLIVTGKATGEPVDPADLRRVHEAVPDRRLFVGSGATAETVGTLLASASGIIVGMAIKVDGIATNPVDPNRAVAFASAAGRG